MENNISIEHLSDEILILSKQLSESNSDYLCFSQACSHLGFTTSFMRKLVLERRIPFMKVSNKKLKFSKTDLDNWIREKQVKVMN